MNRTERPLYAADASTDFISALSDLASFEAALVEAYDHLLGIIPPPAAS